MNDEVKISYLAANVSVYQIHVILHSFLALFNELNFSRKLHLIITCTWTKDKKIFVKFWSHSTPSKDHLFQKVEFLVNFCYIWPLNLSKYGSNQLELVDILYAITFHSITVNRVWKSWHFSKGSFFTIKIKIFNVKFTPWSWFQLVDVSFWVVFFM